MLLGWYLEYLETILICITIALLYAIKQLAIAVKLVLQLNTMADLRLASSELTSKPIA